MAVIGVAADPQKGRGEVKPPTTSCQLRDVSKVVDVLVIGDGLRIMS